jgi:DNA modification methylase
MDCALTSPPYFGLRDYGAAGQLGLEPTVNDWVRDLRQVCREVSRVLTPTGALWLNLGDSFSRDPKLGAPAKGLLLAPERLLLALADDDWIVRTKVIWSKSNAGPSSVKDRPSLSYEVIYFLVRQRQYFFDLDSIREAYRSAEGRRTGQMRTSRPEWAGPLAASRTGLDRAGQARNPLGRTPGDVWTVATRGLRGTPHPAIFPRELARRPILASCPVEVCTQCLVGRKELDRAMPCGCGAPTRPGRVMDCFMGSGTTALVAEELGRDWLGIELNADYARLAEVRLGRRPAAEQSAA